MLYSNVKIRSQEKEMKKGVIINVIELGQHGRGRKILKILLSLTYRCSFFDEL